MTHLPPVRRILALAALAAVSFSPATALEVRGYSAAKHNRLLNFPGEPIFHQLPTFNPGFSPAASSFAGIGWPAHPTDWTRHIALVSPWHFVCAAHYPPGADWQIAFLGTDGAQHIHGISNQVTIVNKAGQATDLMLGTLSTPVLAGEGVASFPVLNLPTEASYTGLEMVVCGSFVHASKMPVAGTITLTNDPGFDTTRFIYFDYNKASGGPNDCSYQGGDSGAPAFVMTNGKPGLVGTASGWDDLPGGIARNYMSFIPGYLPQLDALMEVRGYHIRRVDPGTASVTAGVAAMSSMRRALPGVIALSAANGGPDAAHNVQWTLTFGQAPSTVGGASWFCEAQSPTVWVCHRAGIPVGGNFPLTAAWASLPDKASLEISLNRSHDGATPRVSPFSIPLLPSYASFVAGLADPAPSADPDNDGISNLLEYALGGDPAQSTSGVTNLPRVGLAAGNRLTFSYPRRTDAVARGISETVEYSPSPSIVPWQTALPAGTQISIGDCVPARAGFECVTLSLPHDSVRGFVRLKVELSE